MNTHVLSRLVFCLLSLHAALAEIPPISPADPASVQQGIDAALKEGATKVVIAPGIYRLPVAPKQGSHLSIISGSNLEIEATGVTFLSTDREKPMLRFERCQGITLRGATLLREPIPFSQGRIEAIGEDKKSVVVRVAQGYPADVDDLRFFPDVWLNVFDPGTRRWKRDFFHKKELGVERLGPDSFRYPVEGHVPADVAVGDLVSWRGKVLTDIVFGGCAKMKVIGVTIKNGGGFCVLEEGGEGDNYYNYTVTYGPKPEGAKEEPLMACNADAFHSSRMRKGPTLEGCFFEGMDDDGVPIHGSYAMVMESAGNKVIVEGRAASFCRPGDTLQIYDAKAALAGVARVSEVKALAQYEPKEKFPLDYRLYQDNRPKRFLELTLAEPAQVSFGFMLSNINAIGSGFVVRNCTVRNHRARGMLIKASDGLIEGCTVEGSTMGGIVVGPEMCWWNEADYSQRLVIRNNVIRAVSAWEKQAGSSQCGALTIAAHEHGRFVPLPGGNREIVVENNRFESNLGPNIVVTSSKGVVIKDNLFVNPMARESDHGASTGINPGALIWITESEEVKLQGNLLKNPGPGMKNLLDVTPTVQGEGFVEGVTLGP